MTDTIRDDGRATGIIPRSRLLARVLPALLAALVSGCSDADFRGDGSCDLAAWADGESCVDGLCVPDRCQGILEFGDPALERAVRRAAGGVEGALEYANVSSTCRPRASAAGRSWPRSRASSA